MGNANGDFELLFEAALKGDATDQHVFGLWLIQSGKTDEGVKWLEKAALQGNADAQASLGALYTGGDGVVQDLSKAAEWFEKAARQGHIEAQVYLGWWYASREDFAKATEWFEKAARQGHAGAQSGLDSVRRDLAAKGNASSLSNTSSASGFEFSNGTIIKYTGSDTKVVIPDTIKGQRVTTIGKDAFNNCFHNLDNLTSVNIPFGVTTIEDTAFQSCNGLISVNIPSSLITIGKGAFQFCGNLKSVNIPSGVTTIGYEAFSGCSSLTSVNIPSGVTEIAPQAFKWCESLISMNIPSSVTTIGFGAFFLCKRLRSMNIPPSMTTIGWEAFRECKRLTSVNIPPSVTTIDKDAFEGCKALDNASREAIRQINSDACPKKKGGCYVATAVYGSYDCPQVWTLRRYRDFTLAESPFGRAFISVYYAVSPTVVKWFGKKTWFNHLWRSILDRNVENLRKCGIPDTPYTDRVW